MKAILHNLNASEDPLLCSGADIRISFGPFLKFIRSKAATEFTVRRTFYQWVLDSFAAFPELEEPLDVTLLQKYESILEAMYAVLAPSFSEEKDILWALATPVSPIIFYGTDAIYKLLDEISTEENMMLDPCLEEEHDQDKMRLVYMLILEKIYGFQFSQRYEPVYAVKDESTLLNRYFKVKIDTRFLDVIPNLPLPELNIDQLEWNAYDSFDYAQIERMIPLRNFIFEGITVITLEEVTADQSLQIIRNAVLKETTATMKDCFEDVLMALQTLIQDRQVKFGLFPLVKINQQFRFYPEICQQSLLLQISNNDPSASETYQDMAEEYLKNPRLLYFKKINADLAARYPFLQQLYKNGISSYALVPVFNNKLLVGMLEVFTRKSGSLNEKILSRLDPSIPLLAQLLEHSINQLQNEMENIVKEKFTFLQPAVEWKFNDIAWQLMRKKMLGNPIEDKHQVLFEQVFPLYGAIDIRNSTHQRNLALHQDLRHHFSLLEKTFAAIQQVVHLDVMNEILYKCRKVLKAVEKGEADNDRIWLNEFMEQEVNPFLHHIKIAHPPTQGVIEQYFEVLQDTNGPLFLKRNRLEHSMQLINQVVSKSLLNMQEELQKQFPFYFEKFRTDGVEYDIYIGQSLAPDRVFNPIYLRNLRLWQLRSMAQIAQSTHALIPQMEIPLQTTQLIFVHGNPIDISFRDDERRFDVEGAYNIRYHVIKKRIDKVTLKGSSERLTQPGKIAIVFFNQREEAEYTSFIRFLQEEGWLQNDLEKLNLEPVQGVTGLQALRVGIVLPPLPETSKDDFAGFPVLNSSAPSTLSGTHPPLQSENPIQILPLPEEFQA